MSASPEKKTSAEFWNRNPCGGIWDSLDEQTNWRYSKEPWVMGIIDRMPIEGKTVLEVGCGPGLDTIQLSLKARHVIGIDMSFNSLAAARENMRRGGVVNVSLALGDAEELPFKDSSIDMVYSYGVLHHTPGITSAVDDIHRVLRKGGSGAVMLYRSHTIQSAIISLVRGTNRIIRKLSSRTPANGRPAGNVNPVEGTSVQELLYCPILDRYSKSEARDMFGKFTDVKIECYQTGFSRLLDFLPLKGRVIKTLGRLLWSLERLTQGFMGYYMVVYFKKPY